ncbi:MAG TPA: hypothetical protein VJ962_10550 [Clostridia bacterium]|nr:hypothetical protein [Clostridia bacterium]
MDTNKTTDRWTKEINDFSTLPETLQLEINKILDIQDNNHPLALKVPANEDHESPETFLIIFDDIVYILENENGYIETYSINYSNINFVELQIILLDSYTVLNDGIINKKIFFNTSSEGFFHQLIKKIRSKQNSNEHLELNYENIDYLEEIDIKLYNYSKYALKFHHDIVDSVYQNETSESAFGSSITILTDSELIFIKEPNKDKQPMDSLYGGQWVYIPLNKVVDASIQNDKTESKFSLVIQFKDNHHYSIDYDYMTKSSFKDFDKEILALI